VGVEKLNLSKLAEKTLRQEALQTTFLIFLDIFYPPNFRCFEKNGVFQQPRLISTVNPHPSKSQERWGRKMMFFPYFETASLYTDPKPAVPPLNVVP
jgi:hypothetical protein